MSSDGAIEVVRAVVLITKNITFRSHQLVEGGLVHDGCVAGILNGHVQIDQSGRRPRSSFLADAVNDESTVAQNNLLTTGLEIANGPLPAEPWRSLGATSWGPALEAAECEPGPPFPLPLPLPAESQ